MPAPAALARRDLGETVTDGRSSWVRRLATPRGDLFIKTYDYCTCASRLRNFGRWTAPWRRSRATREFDALRWMQNHGLPAPEPLATYEWRRWGFLVRASLVTAAFPGEATSVLLPRLPPGERSALADAIGQFVGRLHRLGFRDRNLDLRNLLAHATPDGWAIVKIDSPRHRLCAPGRRTDSLARADWQRLLPQLEPFALAARALAAAEVATADVK